ncbi:MAG: twin-arginine translocase TatA/TatE family subunit [Deltaproteobacteria bacterium]|nr:twin-arginine translocase TatA/TatE family subunit [Deltaproteobacteria bacterium]
MRLGPWEIAIIVGVLILIFGPSKLPALGKGLADFLKNFKGGMKEAEKETKEIKDQLKL